MRIIPAIDIIDGKCVRLTKGDYGTKKVYHDDPIEVAKQFEAHGIECLHLVDLDGAKSNRIINYNIISSIATNTKLKIDFGGGLKSDEDIRIAFESGASQVTGGSIAVKNKDLFLTWISRYGADKIILGADCLNRKIATQGWLENSEMDVVTFIDEYQKCGVKYVICTDISKDGMLQGTANELYQEILKNTQVNLIASGGVSSLSDLVELKKIGCEGVIVGKAIYEGQINLAELSEFCLNK
ncbi:MAG: 1-(5-phosphoribosyl)-5-[(5-phosphoribosylamino)methylideneamino]imidazole-4-carboxamide isomerase [Crocinitomicaceae bacterium]|nr:1-(5-phosphoribosyl)-5-[(5-phosphoribosylamino)methylideneamino]imidazole-4-carboxamide isomerase [Crocinitomicaceae bacterium]MBK8926082.1 1-(5-phosphoribosyl)-5-[(5-phosphoribosylamino)methylideneamino]imidazole-4-carboxamide isomerase [Crocinitomicaceae bacterium]